MTTIALLGGELAALLYRGRRDLPRSWPGPERFSLQGLARRLRRAASAP